MNTERGENDGPEREGETSRDHPFWSRPLHATLWSACVIAASALVMLALSWRKWGDPVVDFGTEIYIAWQLHEGAVFFRDVRHTYSPLSPYINAGWFTLFGVSYRGLIVGNAIVLTVLLVLMHRVLRRIASLPATTAALVFFVLVFAFGQYRADRNYNYLGPYAHEVTHGLTLAFLALLAFSRYAADRGRMALIACGLALGFVFLTKYEVFLAGTCAVLIGLITRCGEPIAEAGSDTFSASSPRFPSLCSCAGPGSVRRCLSASPCARPSGRTHCSSLAIFAPRPFLRTWPAFRSSHK